MFPTIPSYPAHPDQIPPTPSATRLLSTILLRPISTWSLEDFSLSDGPDGLSTLISLFVDFTLTRHGHITTEHHGLIAHRARITHPARLLHMMKSGTSIDDYISRSRTMAIPPLLEEQLCPARASDLVTNDGLRARIHDQKLTRGDLLQIILPFAQQFYSSDLGLPAVIRQMTFQEIHAIVYTPGAFRRDLRTRGRATQFAPPCWFNLHPAPTSADAGGTHPLHLIPLMHMGIPLSDFCALPFMDQKALALTALPSYLADKLPPATVLQALITIGRTEPAEVLPLLQPTAFHALLNLPPPAPVQHQVTYRFHLVFKHDGLSSTRCWRGNIETVLDNWLRIVHPLITGAGYSMTLTLSPHLVQQDNVTVDDTSIAYGGFQQYAYKAYPRPTKFKRFKLWLTSDCPAFDIDLDN